MLAQLLLSYQLFAVDFLLNKNETVVVYIIIILGKITIIGLVRADDIYYNLYFYNVVVAYFNRQ